MSKQRRTADDFVRDMKAKQHRRTIGDVERKTSEGLTPEEAGAKKDVAATDKKKEVTSLHALGEPADLTLVEGAKGAQDGPLY
jgi:hypothetical protein